jgi:hypothetical protein
MRNHQTPPRRVLPSQLNVQADLLATTFQRASNHATDRGPLLPGTGCQVLIQIQFIPSQHYRKLRARWGHSQLMKYIQQKHQLSEVAVSSIDWTTVVTLGNQKLQDHQQHIYGKWLPVGKSNQPLQPRSNPSQCPSCSCAIEDFDHAFRCPDRNRRRRRSDLIQALLRSTIHRRIFHLHHLTFHVRFHPFWTISLPMEKFVSRPRF